MKKTILAVLIVLCGNAHAEGFLKQGLWEVKMTKQVMDGHDMTAQMAAMQAKMQQQLANMPPAQRAQIEAMIAGHGAYRLCVSAEMAARNGPILGRERGCEPASFNRSGNTSTFEFSCTVAGQTRTGKGTATRDGDTITTSVDMKTTDAKGVHAMQAETQMTFLGADCQGVKPADQLGK